MRIGTHRYEEVDIKQIARFTFNVLQTSPELRRDSPTLEGVEEHIRGIKDAHIDNRLVCWLGLFQNTPALTYVESWHPLIRVGDMEDEIASALIGEAISFMKKNGRERLEIFLMDLIESRRPMYERYRKWYESQGMQKDNEWVFI